ncbi:MAG: radical SAM protein [Sedimentisphaerales bacterium]|nr:radical SAM protein [Sedimentisphaerales bacterium]
MINISKLYCDQVTPGDWLRYGKKGSGEREGEYVPKKACERKPIVVWNITRACNLKCVHCYNDSGVKQADDELSTSEAKAVLDDLGRFGVPSVLFSGGEPLMRHDLFELIKYATGQGLRAVISTNGTLITAGIAGKIKQSGVSYVGISLDGIGEVNNKFRGVDGAFERAVEGIRNCQNQDVRIGLRLTLTKKNVQELERLFDFFESENIERACFYHLVPSGRGSNIAAEDLTHEQTRNALDLILTKTKQYKQAGRKTDILTVDNHVDGVYVYLKLKEENPSRAEDVLKLLEWNGGGLYSSGVGIGCIDFHGKVHPDQFWGHYNLGDIRKRRFSDIWNDTSDSLLAGLKDRRSHIKGRCRLCKYFDLCGGSLRVRADLHFGSPWAPDPACYLTDDEIGLDENKLQGLANQGEVFPMPA